MHYEKIPFRNHHLNVLTNGNTEATPILFLHGNSSSTQTWAHQFNSDLSDQFYLLAYDFLGFGDSDHSTDPASDYSITALKESLRAVIDHYNLRDYYLVGHSLGGHIIAQSLDELEGCKGIMSIGAPPITVPPDIPAIYLPTAPVGVMFVRDCTEEALQGVAENFFYAQENIPADFKHDFKRADPSTREAIGAILGSDQFRDEQIMYNNSPLRKIFVCGEHERSINNKYYESLDFPNTLERKLYTIPESSHVPHVENAAAFNDIIRQMANE